MQSRRRRQALQYIFQYSPKEGKLSIYCPNASALVRNLQQIFAETILNIEELGEDVQDNQIYDLKPLLNPEFRFAWKTEWGIEDVQLVKLRLTRRFSNQRVVLKRVVKTEGKRFMNYSVLGATQRVWTTIL